MPIRNIQKVFGWLVGLGFTLRFPPCSPDCSQTQRPTWLCLSSAGLKSTQKVKFNLLVLWNKSICLPISPPHTHLPLVTQRALTNPESRTTNWLQHCQQIFNAVCPEVLQLFKNGPPHATILTNLEIWRPHPQRTPKIAGYLRFISLHPILH